jgi:hypothetical protein
VEADREPLDASALIGAAAGDGYNVTNRMLQRWRGQGLLPPGRRGAGGPAVWLYPAGSARQLLRLLHWRSRSRHHRGILLALWVEGFPIELARVRTALPLLIDEWEEMARREVVRAGGGSETTAVAALGAEMARRRSKAPLPHRARMSLAERERAYAYMAASILGNEEELRLRDLDLPALERLLGLRTGRDGGLSRELGLRNKSGAADRLPTPAQARAAITAAHDDEFELARRGVWVLVNLVPVTMKQILAEEGVKAVDLIEVIDHVFGDPPADSLALLVPTLLVSLRAHGAAIEETRKQLAALAPAQVGPELAALAGVELTALTAW